MIPKINKAELLNVMKLVEKQYGVGSVYTLDSNKANLSIDRWSTGIEQLDYILGGGMPYGRIIELFGAESSGKTSLGYHLSAQHKVALNIPIEGTFDATRAKSFGNKKGQFIIRRADYGEAALEFVREFAKAGCPIAVLDSVPACVPKKLLGEEDYEKEQQPGMVAKMFSDKLPRLNHVVESSGMTLILINQLRDTMNAMLFGPKDHTPGGRAIKFYSSVRIGIARKEWIKITNRYDPKNSAKMLDIGLIMKVKVHKSKVCQPLGECEIPLLFDYGFVSFDEIPKLKKEIQSKLRNGV